MYKTLENMCIKNKVGLFYKNRFLLSLQNIQLININHYILLIKKPFNFNVFLGFQHINTLNNNNRLYIKNLILI